jgi:hypothetical protein
VSKLLAATVVPLALLVMAAASPAGASDAHPSAAIVDAAREAWLAAAGGDLGATGVAGTLSPRGWSEAPITLGDALARLDALAPRLATVAPPTTTVGFGFAHDATHSRYCDHADLLAFGYGSDPLTVRQVGPPTGTVCGIGPGYATQAYGGACAAADYVVPPLPPSFGGVCSADVTYGGNAAFYRFVFFGYHFDYVIGDTATWTAQ